MRDAFPAPPRRSILIAALGNRFRSDDGVACDVAEALRREADGSVRILLADDVLSLIDAWSGHDAAIVVDAMQSGAPPGTVREIDAISQPLPLDSCSSSHGIELAHAIEIARRLDRLPRRLTLIAIEGLRFDSGTRLSREVEAAVPRAVDTVRNLLERLRRELNSQ